MAQATFSGVSGIGGGIGFSTGRPLGFFSVIFLFPAQVGVSSGFGKSSLPCADGCGSLIRRSGVPTVPFFPIRLSSKVSSTSTVR